MNILIIPEDPTYDQHILKPLFERLFRSLGKGGVHLRICRDPVLGGVTEALKSDRLTEIVDRYKGMVDMFILCVDRDGITGRKKRLAEIEAEFNPVKAFFAENAWEEIETWVLAGLKLPKGWNWADIRAEIHVKEAYFDRLARIRRVTKSPGLGRKRLSEEAASNIDRIRIKCPEDFDDLATRIQRDLRQHSVGRRGIA